MNEIIMLRFLYKHANIALQKFLDSDLPPAKRHCNGPQKYLFLALEFNFVPMEEVDIWSYNMKACSFSFSLGVVAKAALVTLSNRRCLPSPMSSNGTDNR